MITAASPMTMMLTTEPTIAPFWFSARFSPGGASPHTPEFDMVKPNDAKVLAKSVGAELKKWQRDEANGNVTR
jgi:hypothetical protein